MERTVLVTGAGSGIGRATVLHLSELGFGVLAAVRTESEADAWRKEQRPGSSTVEPLVADLRDEDARHSLVGDREIYGLVNGAGYLNAGLLADVPSSDVREQLETMVLAPAHLAALVLPSMVRRGSGCIVNIESIVLADAVPMFGWYRAAKAALAALTDAQRIELADYGINVVGIQPGGFATPIWAKGRSELTDRRRTSVRPEVYDRTTKFVERMESAGGDPADVAETIGRVLTSGRPQHRYHVGGDAGAIKVLTRLLPERIRNRVVGRVAGFG